MRSEGRNFVEASACRKTGLGYAGVYNEEVFSSLDWILDQASQRGIHLILPIEVQLSTLFLTSSSLPRNSNWITVHCMHLRFTHPLWTSG